MKTMKKAKQKTPEPVFRPFSFTPGALHPYNAHAKTEGFTFSHEDPSPSAPPTPAPECILAEAARVTTGDRQAQYGPPDQDFQRIAQMWSALKGVPFEAREVALFMVCVKLSRETHQRKRDNWVDIAGYARCGSLCREEF